MSSAKKNYTRITTKSLSEMKANGEKIAMLTAYDFTLAGIVDQAGIDIILVGDSASNVMAGHETTLPITLDQMIYHASSVVRAIDRSLVVVDLPFGTYQSDPKEALRSAIRIMKESGGHAVKLEGGKKIYNIVKALTKNNIPVMGHLGLLPQSDKTFKFKGKKISERKKILNDAKLLEDAGVFSIVLECVETSLAKKITNEINIPTIGIGASNNCDGQILVLDDLIGLNPIDVRFVKKYANIRKEITKAVSSYSRDVRKKKFPLKKHSY
jgi:3-methyl-2-oxobutanoate hydroxymethyltransferase